MNLIEELMNRRMILRKENSELYYRLKDNMKDLQKIVQEKLGYILIVNQHLVKLEKIPGKAEPWMGIQEFTSCKEYQMFCFILMFLEDKGVEEQFVLSSLTNYIQMQFEENEIDWTNYTTRRQLVRVVKYCISNSLIKNDDGDEDRFSQDYTTEVLYENTGISRYFLRHFSRDILDFKTPQDFEQSEWIDMDEDRGIVRRQRVYRRLLLSPGIYRNAESDEDFGYLRNYRNQVEQDFNTYFACDLQLHKSSAYLTLADNCMMGKVFPANNGMHDLILTFMYSIRNTYQKQVDKKSPSERIVVELDLLKRKMNDEIDKSRKYLPKKYQEIKPEELIDLVLQEMETMGFICFEENQVIIFPICGKIQGSYGGDSHVY